MSEVRTQKNEPLSLGRRIGRGGEAHVLSVVERPNQVAKIYHQPSAEREAKVQAMISNPPQQPKTHTAIAWPLDMLYQQNRFVGFTMPLVAESEPIFNYYNPVMRRKLHAQFNWLFLHRAAYNLAVATQAIHAKGHVIGDINESNVLVNEQALVTLVDTDSFQVQEQGGAVFRCAVGKAEYTPPELQGVSFKTVERAIPHDNFGLAVLIFQLLMEGFHPFTAVLGSNMSVGRVDLYCIKQGLFPYDRQKHGPVSPPPMAPPIAMLHPWVQIAFERSFSAGHTQPEQRLRPKEWRQVLQKAEKELVSCPKNKQHVYSNHQTNCPWCALAVRQAEEQTKQKRAAAQRRAQRRRAPRPMPSMSPPPPPPSSRPRISSTAFAQQARAQLPQLSPQAEQSLQYGFLFFQWLIVNGLGWAGFDLLNLLMSGVGYIFWIVNSATRWVFMPIALFIFGWIAYQAEKSRDMLLRAITAVMLLGGISMVGGTLGQLSESQHLAQFIFSTGAGAVIGMAQWLVLRQFFTLSYFWVLISILGWSMVSLLSEFSAVLPWPVVGGLLGLIFGLTQWLILRLHIPKAEWWILFSFVAWLGGWGLGHGQPDDPFRVFAEGQWAVLAGSMYSVLSGAGLVWLFSQYKLRHKLRQKLSKIRRRS